MNFVIANEGLPLIIEYCDSLSNLYTLDRKIVCV
jgi:hypothetical protein